MNIFPKNKLSESAINIFIVIYYIVGIIGFIVPVTQGVFTKLIPFSLLLSAYLVFSYLREYSISSIVGLVAIYILGITIEIVGVQTGKLFGEYTYGNALGPKLYGVPLIIGINWLILSYSTVSFLSQFEIKKKLILFLAPLLMVFYDLFLEKVASKLDMWYWEKLNVPINNYIAWYISGFVMVLVLFVFRVNLHNTIAPVLFCCQFVLFFLLSYLM